MDRGKFYAALRQRNSGVFGASLGQRHLQSDLQQMDDLFGVAD